MDKIMSEIHPCLCKVIVLWPANNVVVSSHQIEILNIPIPCSKSNEMQAICCVTVFDNETIFNAVSWEKKGEGQYLQLFARLKYEWILPPLLSSLFGDPFSLTWTLTARGLGSLMFQEGGEIVYFQFLLQNNQDWRKSKTFFAKVILHQYIFCLTLWLWFLQLHFKKILKISSVLV